MSFRLPRKIKKKLKKMFLLFPSDSKGNSQLAFPDKYQSHYDAYKQGILTDLMLIDIDESTESIDYSIPVEPLQHDELVELVNFVFAEQYRERAIKYLTFAKDNVKCKKLYNIIVNSWNETKNGNDKSINVCLAYDDILKLYGL